MKPFVRHLVSDDVSNHEIHRTFCAISANGATVNSPTDTSAVAIYIEYSLLNHMCRPNCGWEEENGAVSVFALEDIEAGDQLGISYLRSEYCLYVREVRRKELMDVFGFNCHCSVCLGEEVTGSKQWLLDQQKRSLIAPWSHQMVKKIMEQGWGMICPRRKFTTLLPSQIIQVLEPEVRVQRSYLDKSNSILILTAKVLITKYSELGESEKAIDCFMSVGESGMATLLQYGTVLEATEIIDQIAMSYLQLERMKEYNNMVAWMQQLLPKPPSAESIYKVLGLFMKNTKQDKPPTKEWEIGNEKTADVLRRSLESGPLSGVDISDFQRSSKFVKIAKQLAANAINN